MTRAASVRELFDVQAEAIALKVLKLFVLVRNDHLKQCAILRFMPSKFFFQVVLISPVELFVVPFMGKLNCSLPFFFNRVFEPRVEIIPVTLNR